jgi:hypothetical protein
MGDRTQPSICLPAINRQRAGRIPLDRQTVRCTAAPATIKLATIKLATIKLATIKPATIKLATIRQEDVRPVSTDTGH